MKCKILFSINCSVTPATFQGLDRQMWLAAPILDNADRELSHYHRTFFRTVLF